METFNIQLTLYENALHDMRLPLSIVHTTVQILRDMELGKNVKDHLNTAESNCYRILKLVNDAGDFATASKGELEPVLHNYDLVFLVKKLTEGTELIAQKKQIDISFESVLEQKIIAIDKNMLERILLNLISNALNFTQKFGEVKVILKENGNNVDIIVRDNGKGIDQDKINQIFNRYTTTDKGRGWGVGLSIVKELTDALGGEISAKRNPIQGSEFTLSLPDEALEVDGTKYEVGGLYADNIVQIELAEHFI